MLLDRKSINFVRFRDHAKNYPDIKDPSIVKVADKWMLYASIGNSVTQRWIVGRFVASTLDGKWQELAPVEIQGMKGPQMCAPAVIYEEGTNSKPKWTMYIQTACFEENGVISSATSEDGYIFTSVSSSLVRADMVSNKPHKVVGIYDAGISDIDWKGEKTMFMVFSGYRSIGNGDLYMIHKRKEAPDAEWSIPILILKQEEVPFHNQPGSRDYEWGLEGAKIVQLSPDCFMLIGVCFAPLPLSYLGHRQRVFFAISRSPFGPFSPIGIPFLPISLNTRSGEQGHPDTVIDNNDLWIIYQERKNKDAPWYLCYAKLNFPEFIMKVEERLILHESTIKTFNYDYYFDTPLM